MYLSHTRLVNSVNLLSNYGTPVSLSVFFNWGIFLRVLLRMQIFSRLILSMHYSSNIPFDSLIVVLYDIKYRFILHHIHQLRASFFMLFIFIHIFKALFFSSPKNKLYVWIIGFLIVLISFGISFLRYVLPFGQISFWGATVITNLISVVPYFRSDIVSWVWRGFLVDLPTVNRFYTLHFILPFVVLFLVVLHLLVLHNGRSSRLSVFSIKISFHPFFTLKDLYWVIRLFIFLLISRIFFFDYFLEADNMIYANPLSTPLHIKPEWYFLFVYRILRSIPNKTLGVIALLLCLFLPLCSIFLNSFSYNNIIF